MVRHKVRVESLKVTNVEHSTRVNAWVMIKCILAAVVGIPSPSWHLTFVLYMLCGFDEKREVSCQFILIMGLWVDAHSK